MLHRTRDLLVRQRTVLANALREHLQRRIVMVERSIATWHRSNEVSRWLATIPGIGVITASAITVLVSDATAFRSARQFAAWIGLAPRLSGTGGKVQLGRISKAGNRYLRRLLTTGATSLVRCARLRPDKAAWITALLARRPTRVAITAVANKLARLAWAVLSHGEGFRQPQTAAA